jgi:hypothetical protein
MTHSFSPRELLDEHIRLVNAFDYMIERLKRCKSDSACDVREILIRSREEQAIEIPELERLVKPIRKRKG